MATFLDLCSKLSRRSGAVSAAPATVVAQVGRKAKVVDWVSTGWLLVQEHYSDWTFLQGEWSGSLVASETTYQPEDLGIVDRFAEWKGDRTLGKRIYRPTILSDPDTGASDEGTLLQISYPDWQMRYATGVQLENRPVHYCFAPDGTLRVGPTPNKVYSIRGEYRKAPQELAADADVPDMPPRFHDIIVDRALMLMCEHDEAEAALAGALRTFQERLNTLQRDCLPEITTSSSR